MRNFFLHLLLLIFLSGCASGVQQAPPYDSAPQRNAYDLVFRGYSPSQISQIENYLRDHAPDATLVVSSSTRHERIYRMETGRDPVITENLLRRMLSDLSLGGYLAIGADRFEVASGLDERDVIKSMPDDYQVILQGFERTDASQFEDELAKNRYVREVRLARSQGRTVHYAVQSTLDSSAMRREIVGILDWLKIQASVDFSGNKFTVSMHGFQDGKSRSQPAKKSSTTTIVIDKNSRPSTSTPIPDVKPSPASDPPANAFNYRIRLINFSEMEARQAEGFFARFSGYQNHVLRHSRGREHEYDLASTQDREDVLRNLRKILFEMGLTGKVRTVSGVNIIEKDDEPDHSSDHQDGSSNRSVPSPTRQTGEGQWNNLGNSLKSNRGQ